MTSRPTVRLVGTADNPIPEGGRVMRLVADDGTRLRAALWTPPGATRGTVAIFGGRGEFIEKYFETVDDLLARGFAVASVDWRGQGGSERSLRDPRKGHVDDFSLYGRDLRALAEQVLAPYCPRPWYGLAHSMGAAILLAEAHAGSSPFERLLMTSPMIDIYGIKYPRGARALALALDTLGLGGRYAPGGGSRGVEAMDEDGNVLTSDSARFRRMISIASAAPDLTVGCRPSAGSMPRSALCAVSPTRNFRWRSRRRACCSYRATIASPTRGRRSVLASV